MKRTLFASTLCFAAASGALLAVSSGCGRQQPVAMAPPVSAPPPQAPQGSGSVYQWQDVPAGQQVPITRAVFDQGGYQLYAQTGETIVVPFANQNMYVMKFGQSGTGQMYFVQDGNAPTLFVPRGAGLENANAQGARWYPFSQDFQYQRPVYVGIAPTWSAFTGMGWYPGMSYYGGYWGYNPYSYNPMVGLMFNIGGRPYYGWNSYTNYYRSNPGYIRPTRTFNYASTGRTAPGSFGRNRGTGSFGSSRSSGGGFSSARPSFGSGGSGSFGSSRRSGSGSFSSAPPGPSSTGSFGSSGRSSTFGSGGSSSSGFGSSGQRSGSGSFGSSGSSSSGYRPFGGGRSSGSGGSFGGGSFGRSSSSSSSSSGFGGFGRSSSSSSGGFGRSSGGGSFGGSRSSGGFGGRRR